MSNIYVIGDSFSAGAELADHTFLSYKQFKPTTIQEYHLWLSSKEYSNELKNRGNDYMKHLDEMTRAWPAKLANITGANVINKSFGGSGAAGWRGQFLVDLVDFKEIGLNLDICIVQITDYYRSCLFDSTNTDIIYNHLTSYNMDYGTDSEKQYLKSKLKLQTEPGFFFNFLLDLASLKMTAESFGVKKFEVVASNSSPSLFINDELTKIYDIQKLVKFLSIDFNNLLTMQPCDNDILPGGHFSEQVHEDFAQKLKEHLNL